MLKTIDEKCELQVSTKDIDCIAAAELEDYSINTQLSLYIFVLKNKWIAGCTVTWVWQRYYSAYYTTGQFSHCTLLNPFEEQRITQTLTLFENEWMGGFVKSDLTAWHQIKSAIKYEY